MHSCWRLRLGDSLPYAAKVQTTSFPKLAHQMLLPAASTCEKIPAIDGHSEPSRAPLDSYLLRLHLGPFPLGLPERQPNLLTIVLPRVRRDLLRPASRRRR